MGKARGSRLIRCFPYAGRPRPFSTKRTVPLSDTMMKALVLRQHGGLDQLAVVEHPRPRAIEGHVVIRVRASSFNYHDVFTVKGMPGIKVPLPVIPGLDMAGGNLEE